MNRLTIVLLSVLILVACEKENISIRNILSDRDYIITGKIGDNDTLYTLAPKISLDSENSQYYELTDSVDIFNDGAYDIKFSKSNELYKDNDIETDFGGFSIYILSDIELAQQDNKYISENIEPFKINDTINEKLFWTNNEDYQIRRLFTYPPGDGFEWRQEETSYLAFRKTINNDTIYGWIRIDNLNTISVYGVNK